MKKKSKKKHCKKCGKELCKNNKSGYCNEHRDRTGKNNSFYGKHHTKETKKILSKKCSIGSKKKWQDEEYVKHVKKGLKSEKNKAAHTSKEFREKQSKNAKKQMQDKKQLEIRSKALKKTWKTGKIKPYHTQHNNEKVSNIETNFGDMLKEKLGRKGRYLKGQAGIRHIDNPKRFYHPDFIYKNIVIEFNGDFWHARNMDDDEILLGNVTAKEVREHDKDRIKTYRKRGYYVIIVWESDFKKNKESTITKVYNKIIKHEKNNFYEK